MFKPPSLWYFVKAALANKYRGEGLMGVKRKRRKKEGKKDKKEEEVRSRRE